jgi:EmrB/QacA subfamily drug resistance transporter
VRYKPYPKIQSIVFDMQTEGSSGSQEALKQKLRPFIQFALIAGPFLTMVDSSVVNIALPVIAKDFQSSLTSVQWILSGYLLALAAVLPASAFLSKRFGARKIYFWSIVGFTAASFFCALSFNLDSLISARVLQGALGAPLVPLAMDMLFKGPIRGGRKTADVSPALGMILFLAPALGPSLGGYLIGYVNWQSIFLINVPIGIVSAIFVWHYAHEIPSNEPDASLRFDTIGFILISLGLIFTVYGASEGPLLGWLSIGIFPFLVAGVALIGAYVLWAMGRRNPAINLKLIRHLQTALALTISIIAAVVLFAVLFLLPVFMESFQGLSVEVAGLALLPQGLVTGIGTVLGDKLTSKQGIRRSVILGMVTLTASTAALLVIDVQTSAWVTALILCGRGLALGLTIQPLLIGIIGSLTGSEISDGNTLFNVFQRLGGTLGVSLLSSFLELREQYYISKVLAKFGISSGSIASSFGQSGSNSSLSSLPSAIRSQLANAAVSGFHDTVVVLIAVSFFGLVLAMFIQNVSEEKSDSQKISSGQ